MIRQMFLNFELLLIIFNRYRPGDLNYFEAASKLKKAQEDARKGYLSDPTTTIKATFRDVLRRFQPVMRHYFTERHKTPISWFAKRLNYTRSVATTSIVGHILGLGDRHISNILLDNASGQVVHIDLGIAFDQASTMHRCSRLFDNDHIGRENICRHPNWCPSA